MTQWIALVHKFNLEGGQSYTDIAYTEADTKEKAVEAIVNYAWPEPWWTKQCRCSVLKIFDTSDPPHWAIVLTAKTTKPTRRRRVRYE